MTLTNIKTPDYCTIDFEEEYTVSLSAGSTGTVSPASQTTGYNGSVSFTVTSNTGSTELTKNTCNGVLSGNTLTISNVTSSKSCEIEFKQYTLSEKLFSDNPTISTRTDFSTTFTTTNTGTLYKTSESIAGSTAIDVYYFAGNATNNWVKFANFYWRIIRTNYDGSIKLLYAGTSTDTTSGYIGTSAFNSLYSDPMYAGYMYGTSGSLASNRTNENNSTIKGVIDTWYSNNLNSYTKYISTEAVYCNNREVGYGTYCSSCSSEFRFLGRTNVQRKTPSYNCTKSEDAFSASTTGGGNGKLTYPIGLMTADETAYAGGNYQVNAPIYYYQNSVGNSITAGMVWWLISPDFWYNKYIGIMDVHGSDYPGNISDHSATLDLAIRPVIGIKSDTIWSRGDGSPENPYEIVYN